MTNDQILHALLKRMRKIELAVLLGTTPQSIDNWLSHRTKPQPYFESQLRKLYIEKEKAQA